MRVVINRWSQYFPLVAPPTNYHAHARTQKSTAGRPAVDASLPVNPPAHAGRRLIRVEIRKSVEKSGNHLRNRKIRKSAKKSDENRDIAGNREFVIRNLEITKEIMKSGNHVR